MKSFTRVSIGILALLAGSASLAAERPCVGWVDGIRPPASWRAGAGSREVRLDPAKDRYRGLCSGEQVRCEGSGSLKLLLNGKPRTVTARDGWFPIPPPVRTVGPAEGAISEYGRLLGGERPVNSAITSPADGSQVRPESLVIRWTPRPSLKTITLSIRTGSGEELWKRPVQDASTGELADDAARAALVQHRARGGKGPLTLRMAGLDGSLDEVHFDLLPADQEKSLKEELALFDGKPGLLRRVGRAYAFSKRRLYAEAAEEYEAALKEAPESAALTERAIYWHRKAGNTVRAEELEKAKR